MITGASEGKGGRRKRKRETQRQRDCSRKLFVGNMAAEVTVETSFKQAVWLRQREIITAPKGHKRRPK